LNLSCPAQVVLADGTVLETGGRARKSSAGYDLTRLFVGSEGTLGVITEVALALHPSPSHVSAATVRFETLAAAVEAVEGLRLHGVPVARCELLDATTLAAFNAYNAGVDGFSPQPLAPSLFLEFHGARAAHRLESSTCIQLVFEVFRCASRTRRAPSIRPKVGRIDSARAFLE
jgi:D-lactate dehydrogenase (cytochrome)